MADWLRPRLPRHCAVIASPAVRTRTTATALQPGYALDERLAPGADAAAVLAACGWPDGGRRDGAVLVVGHQPTLGQAASLLLTGAQADWSVRKGAIWWLSTRERDAHDQVVLRAVLSPDLIGQDVA